MHYINNEIRSCENCQSLKKSTGGKEICPNHDGKLLEFEKEICDFCKPDQPCAPHIRATQLLDQELERAEELEEESEKNENEAEMEPPSKKGRSVKRKATDNKNK